MLPLVYLRTRLSWDDIVDMPRGERDAVINLLTR